MPAVRRKSRPDAPLDEDRWQERLSELAEEHKVPGAVLGIMRVGRAGSKYGYAATGVLSLDTGVRVTPDTLFQIGSITKVWTTALLMQLIDLGSLQLDTPVIEILPRLRLADKDTTQSVTVRHLLTHTSGIDGDVFTDTGRGDDALRRYVEDLSGVPQLHRPGRGWSYSNAGFCLAGRLVEVITGTPFEEEMRERILRPLSLTHTALFPEEALLHRTAVGHLTAQDGTTQPSPVWGLPRAVGPAGLICASAPDVLSFARAFLPGSGVIPHSTVRQMTDQQIQIPAGISQDDSWGLGWARREWDGCRIFGHGGHTIGQTADLQVCPQRGIAMVVLANGGDADRLRDRLVAEVFKQIAGVDVPPPLATGSRPTKPASLVGRYERTSVDLEIAVRDGEVIMTQTETSPFVAGGVETSTFEISQLDERRYVASEPGGLSFTPVVLGELEGRRCLYLGVRAFLLVP